MSSLQTSRPPRHIAYLVAGFAMFGPFSIDAMFPGFPAISAELSASPIMMQQIISIYLIGFASMSLVHGPLSDAYGRRKIVFWSTLIFVIASAGAALSHSMTLLLIWRLIQGCSAGGGVIVGRAIIRDLVAGPEAHRMIAQVMMIFAVSPAIAPIAGAFLCGVGGWRVVFLATGIFAVVLLLVATLTLPESLPVEHRFPTNLASLLDTYRRVSRDWQFMLLSMSNALNFGALFLYISSAPRFILDFLHLSIGDFYWFFVPAVVGILAGSALASRCSRRFSHSAVLRAGFGLMIAAGIANAGMNEVLQKPVLPWAVVPITFLASGIALNQPLLTLLGLERFPRQRGAASSMQAFLSLLVNATVSGVLSPAVSQTPFTLSAAALAISAAGFLFWFAAGRPRESAAHEITGEETTTAE